jgi:hypothetical protein
VQQLPRELQQAIDDILKQHGPEASARPPVAARMSVVLACWLHGSVTTEQAIDVLRSPSALPRR